MLPLALRRQLFRLLERAAAWRSRTAASDTDAARGSGSAASTGNTRSLWVFVSTIGELNAIEPFLVALLDRMGQPQLTLISDRHTYDDAYRTRYPAAAIEPLDGSTGAVDDLLQRRPPLMLLVAEIPGLLHDAPCRFSFATVDGARRAGAPVVLVNGWLYGYAPPSRLDLIENRLFQRDYVRAFDLLVVQTDAVRDAVTAAGADPQRVVVAGNIKFDALRHQTVPDAPLPNALRARAGAAASPVVVGGSVTETADQAALIGAFVALRVSHPRALLVLAPRHPEDRARMAALGAILDRTGLDWRLRSDHPDADSAGAADVLVLDTMGELRGCYAASTLAFVGTDHNVLEPLAFGVPVFVFGPACWVRTYPSYPVYSQLLDKGVIRAVPADADAIAACWLQLLSQPAPAEAAAGQRLAPTLLQAQGAVDRSLDALQQRGLLAPAAVNESVDRRTPYGE